MTQDRPEPAAPEPLFNAPWPALLAAASILVPHLLLAGMPGAVLYDLALVPARVGQGDYAGLVTSLFVHGGWTHAIMNAAFALAFGAPVARFLGPGAKSAALFVLFYIACGVLAGLGYTAVHPSSIDPLVGASGAVSGLMGAAARMLDRPGTLSSPTAPRALSTAIGWLVVNLILAVVGGVPGVGAVAWEAHLFGFVAGALLIGPLARLVPRAEIP